MKLSEENNPTAHTHKGFIGVNDDAARDNINVHLAAVTACAFITPYVALERVRKILAQFHIFLPKVMFLDGEHGVETWPTNQFGEVMGVRNDGSVASKIDDPYHVYFEYQLNGRGMFDIFCEIVNEDELEELLDEVEGELNNDDAEDERDERLDEDVATPTRRFAGHPFQGLNRPVPANVQATRQRNDAFAERAGKEIPGADALNRVSKGDYKGAIGSAVADIASVAPLGKVGKAIHAATHNASQAVQKATHLGTHATQHVAGHALKGTVGKPDTSSSVAPKAPAPTEPEARGPARAAQNAGASPDSIQPNKTQVAGRSNMPLVGAGMTPGKSNMPSVGAGMTPGKSNMPLIGTPKTDTDKDPFVGVKPVARNSSIPTGPDSIHSDKSSEKKNKEYQENMQEALSKDELTAIRLAGKMQLSMKKKSPSAETLKPQNRSTKLKVQRKAIDAYTSMSNNMGGFDPQWKESERNNKEHASKANLERLARVANKEFDAVRRGKPDFEKYKDAYHKHQHRTETIRRIMSRIKDK